jgi:hypothetical protein
MMKALPIVPDAKRRDRPSVGSRLERAGLSPRKRRALDAVLLLLVLAFASGWSWEVARALRAGEPPPAVGQITASPLAADAPPPAVFLLDAALRRFTDFDALRGESGAVRVVVREPGDPLPLPDSLPPGTQIEYVAPGDTGRTLQEARRPGVWNLLLSLHGSIRAVPDLAVLDLVPLTEKRAGRIGTYRIGDWPWEAGGTPRSPSYAPPGGLVRVDRRDVGLAVSEHFTLGDFLTKGQGNVWPKYVALSTLLLDKLELTIDELERAGHPVENVGVISGFRTPYYNQYGGSTGGRGALSRHMYGDAMDFFIDNDQDGRMDDLNRDGRVDTDDGRVIVRAAEAVERRYPQLVGGIGLYRPTSAHAGFVHVDTRGYRARW